MTVSEAIKILSDEDPAAELWVVVSRYRHEPLRKLKEEERGYFDDLRFGGKDRNSGNNFGAVVLIADRDEDRC